MFTWLMLGSLVGVSAYPPVRVEFCRISTPSVITSGNDSGSTITGNYSLRVRFVDDANRTISRVTFRLDDGTTMLDAGTFSPGVTIDHTLLLSQTNATVCELSSVTFADGDSWTTGAAQPPHRSRNRSFGTR